MAEGKPQHAVAAFLVLSRGLGCLDDTASDEEQYQKILYFFPEDTPIARQLQTANMCEGLIDFAARFSENEDLDTVVMKDATYAFKKCEADLWLVAAVSNDSEVEGTKGVSELGMRRLLTQAYQTYFLQHGDVESDLRGMDDAGSHNIQRAKALRKAIRKLNRKLHEIEDDQLHADEDTPLEEVEAKAQAKRDALQERRGLEEQLEDVLAQSPVTRVRRRWQALLRWYLQAQDFSNVNSLHNLSGVHYQTLDASAFRKISRVVFSLKEQTRSLGLKACTVLYEGAVIWNELDEATLLALYEFIRLNESIKQAAAASKQQPARGKYSSMSQRIRSEFSSLQQQDRPAVAAEKQSSGYQSFGGSGARTPSDEADGWKSEPVGTMKSRKFEGEKKAKAAAEAREEQTASGFVGNGWAVLDDKFSQLRSLAEVQTAIFSEYCLGTQGIWCPRIYARTADAASVSVEGNAALSFEVARGLLGRLILYKLGSYLFVLLVDELALSEQKPAPSPTATTSTSSDSSPAVGSPRSARDTSVTVRSVQPICNSIRTSLASSLVDLQDLVQPDNERLDMSATGIRLVCVNQCDSSLRTVDLGSTSSSSGSSTSSLQFPLQPSQLAKHIPDHFFTCIGDAMECFEQRNSRESCYSYCIRASSGDWLFARCHGGRQLFTLVSDQSFFQEAYESAANASRRVLRGVAF